jgi:hypothetical protein
VAGTVPGWKMGRPSRSSNSKAPLGDGPRSSSAQPPYLALYALRTLYDGPGGPRTSRFMNSRRIVVTTKAIEVETTGASAVLSALTCGCWWFLFQSITVEIFELARIGALYMEKDCIVGELASATGVGGGGGRSSCGGLASRCGCGERSRFVFDLSTPDDTRNLYFHLKDAWHAANNVERVGLLRGAGAGEFADGGGGGEGGGGVRAGGADILAGEGGGDDDDDDDDDDDFHVIAHGEPGYGSLREARLERDRYLIS